MYLDSPGAETVNQHDREYYRHAFDGVQAQIAVLCSAEQPGSIVGFDPDERESHLSVLLQQALHFARRAGV